jgi:hypothetical protein
LLVSSDGRRAITTLADGTGLVWDLASALPPPRIVNENLSDELMTRWWDDLASPDAGRAYAAIWRLAEIPGERLFPFLGRHLRPAAAIDAKVVQKLIGDLDNESFKIREQASEELTRHGRAVEAAIRHALDGKLSAEAKRRLEALLSRPTTLSKSPDELRGMRAIQLLERLNTKEAAVLLARLSESAGTAGEAQEAQASLERLSRRRISP